MKAFLLLLCCTIIGYIFIPFSVNVKKEYANYFLPQKEISKDRLRVTFLGVSSLLIQDKKNSILIDGFLTRPNLFKLLFSPLQSDETLIQNILLRHNIKDIDAIITLHSHHDHAMDTAVVAKKTNAIMIGSKSSYHIAKAYNLPHNQFKVIEGKSILGIGDFIITIVPSKHTHMGSVIGKLVGLDEHITKDHQKREYLDAYKEGGTYAVHIKHPDHSLFINGSTAYDAKHTQGLKANTVFLGIAKLGKHVPSFQEAYYKAVVEKLDATTVVPIHWDNFTKGFDKPISSLPLFFDDFDASMNFLIEKSKKNNTRLLLMDFFDTMELKTSSKQ